MGSIIGALKHEGSMIVLTVAITISHLGYNRSDLSPFIDSSSA
jgi:hypothetical protein